MAITELMKSRYNMAKDPNISFYRENSRREVDIVQVNPDGLDIFEVKVGKTFQSDFVKNLSYLKSVVPGVSRSTVIYDGVTRGESLINVRKI